MAGIGEHRAGEPELGLGQCVGSEAGEARRLVVAGLEAVGIGVLHARDHGFGAGILDALVEPERREVAVLVERLDRLALLLGGEELVAPRGQEVADLLGDRAVGGVERGQRIRRDDRLDRGLLLGGGGRAR